MRSEGTKRNGRSEEHTSELQSRQYLVCRLLLEKKNRTDRRCGRRATRTRRCTWHSIAGCLRRGVGRPIRSSSPPTFFFFNDTATTEISTLSLHDALPI